MMKKQDVYSFGVIAYSSLYLLDGNFPARSGYAEILNQYRNIGGEAANTSIVLARLGLDVKLDGNWINPDEDAKFLQALFTRHNIDISRLSLRRCSGPKEMLVVDSTSRTIFGTYSQLSEEKSWNSPQKIDIQNAKIVCLDPFLGQASLQVAQYAQTLNRPVVTVDCKFDHPIYLASQVAIISEEFLKFTYPDDSIPVITGKYRAHAGGIVIFTFGHQEILFGTREEDFQRFEPYQIDPVDTTGAGDSFRAGIIYGFLKTWTTPETIQFASALAAMVCQSFPGVLNSPSYDHVRSFMQSYQRSASL
jgi:sugar/nucleoside kinase (ribokinase family)